MRAYMFAFLLFAFLIVFSALTEVHIYAAPEVNLGNSLDTTELGELEDLARDKYSFDIREFVTSLMRGELKGDKLKVGIKNALAGEVDYSRSLMRSIVLICLINGLSGAVLYGFEGERVADFAACAAMVLTACVGFRECMAIVSEGSTELNELMTAALPVILCISGVTSGAAAMAVFASVLYMLTSIVDGLVCNLILPQISFSVVLGLLNCLCEKPMAGRLSELCAFVASWELKICAMLFVGVLMLGRMGVVPASVGVNKGVKLAVGAVPVVGGLFENSLEAVTDFVSALGGGVAVAVIVLIGIVCAVGLIRIVAVMLVYKLTAALCEGVSGKRLSKVTDCAAEGVKLLIGAYFTVAAMLIASVAVVLGGI
jgi:stage III sporulation protein AE